MRLLLPLLLMTTAYPPVQQQRFEPHRVIYDFAKKETGFRRVFQQYTYSQEIVYEILGADGEPTHRREIVIEIYFTNQGRRQTRVVSDKGQLGTLRVTPADFQIATELQAFVMTTRELNQYDVRFIKSERVDELDTYVFELTPRSMRRGKRYFKGRVWVDSQDLQIVQTKGRPAPEDDENKFLPFETVRQLVDGKYWFPVWSRSEGTLDFGAARYHLRQLVIYKDFKKFEVRTDIQFEKPKEKKPDNR